MSSILGSILGSMLGSTDSDRIDRATAPDGKSVTYWSDGESITGPPTNETGTTYDREIIIVRNGTAERRIVTYDTDTASTPSALDIWLSCGE